MKEKKVWKNIDEEGYYRWLNERDEKRLKWFKKWFILRKFFTIENIEKVVKFVFHMTGTHFLRRENFVPLDGEFIGIYRCDVCGYECTSKGIIWERIKYVFTWIGLIITWIALFLFEDLCPFVAGIVEWLLFFLSLIHALSLMVIVTWNKD